MRRMNYINTVFLYPVTFILYTCSRAVVTPAHGRTRLLGCNLSEQQEVGSHKAKRSRRACWWWPKSVFGSVTGGHPYGLRGPLHLNAGSMRRR